MYDADSSDQIYIACLTQILAFVSDASGSVFVSVSDVSEFNVIYE